MKKKVISLLMIAAFVLTAFAGCGNSSSLTKVTLNEVAHSIFYAPQYIAIELGYFEDEGIDLELVTGFGVEWLIQNKKPLSKIKSGFYVTL